MKVNLLSTGKNVFTSKNWTNKNDTNESLNIGALWRTLRLSFASYDELTFRLRFLHEQ